MKLKGFEKVETGYKEIYELEEADITNVEPKIVVEAGNEWTAIKRPSLLFKVDENSL